MRLIFLLVCIPFYLTAQFAPPAGQVGSTAIHVDSANWLGWAIDCEVSLGLQDIRNSASGYANSGTAASALGAAADGSTLSLGDGGSATLSFAYPIKNGNGPDFAIFENAFNDSFLELAFVEVSSDGQHFVRFPAISNTDTSSQVGSFGSVDARKIHNLAGKYRASYGTPFDLEDLVDSSGIDLQAITHIRLIDVVGSVDPDYASRDHLDQMINDPFPTPFPSSGFDLDAIGVLHFNYQANTSTQAQSPIQIYPNPAQKQINIDLDNKLVGKSSLEIYHLNGQMIYQAQIQNNLLQIDTKNWQRGVYFIKIGQQSHKMILVD